MRRRDFVTFVGRAAALWPGITFAQRSTGKVWRVAYLHPTGSLLVDVFRAELRKLGYVEGENLVIDQRSANGKAERLTSMAHELVALRPDVIVAVATPAIAAAQSATSTSPS